MNDYELVYWRYLFHAWGKWSKQNTGPKSVGSQLSHGTYSAIDINDDTALLIDKFIIEYGLIGPKEKRNKEAFVSYYMLNKNEHEIGSLFGMKPKKVFSAIEQVELYVINNFLGS